MPVLFLVIRIQNACRKAILICLIPIVAGVSHCDRCYHVYVGITFFEGSAPKKEVKRRPSSVEIVSCITTLIPMVSQLRYSSANAFF